MASLILSSAGTSLFGPIGGALGALAGSALDQMLSTALNPPIKQASRLSTLKVQGGGEGVPIPIVFGCARVTGQIIWASRFKEHRHSRRVGGKTGQKVVENSYTISFAIGLCEGPIRGIGQAWANGERFDLSTCTFRLYLGGQTQMPDPLIEALEGLANAPAFRGLAYLVFEDFPVSSFNDRIPNLSFEIMASDPDGTERPRLEALARGVCLIPGAGEFAYATTPIDTLWTPGVATPENRHAAQDRTNLLVSLDQLSRDFPHVDHVSLVVAWFGTDLRAGQCRIEPRVDQAAKPTRPRGWSVAGLRRDQAQMTTRVDGRPAYGGSPDDLSVVEAIAALKARGHQVTLNPFVMMDIAAGNRLPDPHASTLGTLGQAAYPWRGRITCDPGPRQAGTVNGTAALLTQINAFFGTAQASHFSLDGSRPIYQGPPEWSYRRFVLHQATLAKAAGGVEAFLIGSELVGLTRLQGPDGGFPAVAALQDLAAQVRQILGPSVAISYGADWTEYGAYRPPGSTDLRFPLDPLWADPHVDFIGLDWYPPVTDRRPGQAEPDLLTYQAGIEGGEGFDFYYASEDARLSQTRTPITDGAYQEPWVWRVKDIRSFWSLPHMERINGVRQAAPTAWIPQSKPIRLMELGCPAVDCGGNRPSVFPDPKSSEAGLPPFSSGVRDDGEQRRVLLAYLDYWTRHSPKSARDGRAMIDPSHIYLWAWDGRPYPHFPQLQTVWGDGAHAATGHWLAGRAGGLLLADLFEGLAAHAGLTTLRADAIEGYVEGFVVEGPIGVRNVIENLIAPLGLEAWPRCDGLHIRSTPPPVPSLSLSADDFQLASGRPDLTTTHRVAETSASVHLTTFDRARDFEPATYRVGQPTGSGVTQTVQLPLVVDAPTRQALARQLLVSQGHETLVGKLNPLMGFQFDVGDRFSLADGRVWRVDQLAGAWGEQVSASLAPSSLSAPLASYAIIPDPILPVIAAPPQLIILDLPAPFATSSPKPLVGAFGLPWPGSVDVRVGETRVARLTRPMCVGQLVSSLPQTAISQRLGLDCRVRLAPGAVPPRRGRAALVGPDGLCDIIDWQGITWIGDQTWRLNGLVRGYHGMSFAPAIAAGTDWVVLDEALVAADLDAALTGLMLDWTAAPTDQPELATHIQARFAARARIPWSPCHLTARRTAAGIQLSWIRRAAGDGDSWGLTQPPLDPGVEAYRLEIRAPSGQVVRVLDVANTTYIYPNALELADFGIKQSSLSLVLSQLDAAGQPGFALQQTIFV